ncbi:hypothetical protein [Streptomyces sp. NPDC091027]|uniref:hypothetical protein n=1 Tax=Streptomyces sp. NPDC091027 TaxID=3365971 RepID=UPI00381E6C5F
MAEQVLKAREACRSTGRPGKVITLLGSGASVALWWPRAAFSIDGGFEGHARDLGVVFVDLPLIVLGGVLIPCGHGRRPSAGAVRSGPRH